MTKVAKNIAAQNEIVNDATTETGLQLNNQMHEETGVVAISVDEDTYINSLAILSKVAEMKNGIELTAEYVKMEKGQELRGVYAGQHKIQSTKGNAATNDRIDENGMVNAAKLLVQTSDGGKPKFVIMADIKVVGTLANTKPGTAVSITCLGMKKGKNGDYRDFSIQQLF